MSDFETDEQEFEFFLKVAPPLLALALIFIWAYPYLFGNDSAAEPDTSSTTTCQDWPDIPFTVAEATGSFRPEGSRIKYHRSAEGELNLPRMPEPGTHHWVQLTDNIMIQVSAVGSPYGHRLKGAIFDGQVAIILTDDPEERGVKFIVFRGSQGETLIAYRIHYALAGLVHEPEQALHLLMGLVREQKRFEQFTSAVQSDDLDTLMTFRLNDDLKFTVEECQALWVSRHEAVARGCQFVRTQGMDMTLFPPCHAMDNQAAFDQLLYQALEYPECRGTWAELAGHPHPETCQTE